MKICILGAGIAGLGCAYQLRKHGLTATIYEKRSRWGGLCDNFEINGFRFDRFVHLSFAKSDYVNEIFLKQPVYRHQPISFNYADGYWIKHPVQNNLYPLPAQEKSNIIASFSVRKNVDESSIQNYEQWLRIQYGDYFAERYPARYTRKYWTIEPKDMETQWVGIRMSRPSLEEVIYGAENPETQNAYYTNEMRYPQKGGYKSFLNELQIGADIELNKQVVAIDQVLKSIRFADGTETQYDILVSSLPLPEIAKILRNVPAAVIDAAAQLLHTSAYLVSLGFKRPDIAKYLWFYIYDEEILPARVYSPSLKSKDNAPEGCSSLQAEIYFSRKKDLNLSKEDILKKTINALVEMGVCALDDIIVQDVRVEEYANVVHVHDIYRNKEIVLNYLKTLGIYSIGRFGEWSYFWSDQSLLSGKAAADSIIQQYSTALEDNAGDL